MNDLAAALARHPLFSQLSAEERSRICAHTILRQYRRGAIIFAEGDPVRAFMLVRSGTVRLLKRAPDGREQTVTFADVHETLGEIAVFANRPYLVGAEAFTDVTLYALPAQHIRALLQTAPPLAEALISLFANRIGHLYEIIEDLAFRSAVSRVAHLLLGETHVLTQTEMASMVGVSREALNRALHTLEQQGVIGLESGHVTHRDRAQLAEIALVAPAPLLLDHPPVPRAVSADRRDASSGFAGGDAVNLPHDCGAV